MGDEEGTIHWPKICADRVALLSHGSGLEVSEVISKKIHSVFSSVKSFPLKRVLIQFWKPLKSPTGKTLFSCAGYPYAFSDVNRLLWKYRSHCVKYFYSIGEVDDPLTISGAPPSCAVMNHCPEVVLDLRVHRGTPLVDLALECELTCFVMVPVFNETSCLGVIEVSMRHRAGLVVLFNELKQGLKREGLSITPPRSFTMPCKPLVGVNLALREIREALRVALNSHAITLGQVWHSYDSYVGSGIKRQMLLNKLISYALPHSDGDHLGLVKGFYNDMFVFPLEKVKGLVGRTLETHRPHLCRNIYRLSDNSGVLALLSANTKCASFVICLRFCHTGDHDYAFEFIWAHNSNHLALMEGLLLTLKEYLPSFKHASGAQLGHELLVVDVDNSSSGSGSASASGSTTIKLFAGNEISETPKVLNEKRALMGLKQKSVDLHDGQGELNRVNQHPLTNSKNNPEDEDDDLVILAVYKVHCSLFYLPSSPTFENVMEKIKQEFNPAQTYKVKYQVLPGKWYNLTDETCLKSCISLYRASKNIDYIKFYVLSLEN